MFHTYLFVHGVPHCVRGRGRSFYRRQVDHSGDDSTMPVVPIDYGFLGAPGELPQDAVGGQKTPVLVVRDRFTKAIFCQFSSL